MESRKSAWQSFVAFFSAFLRFFSRRGVGQRVQKFSYDLPMGPRPPRLDKPRVTVLKGGPNTGNRWWRRQMSLRGRFSSTWGRELKP